jgi:hypothetical protein
VDTPPVITTGASIVVATATETTRDALEQVVLDVMKSGRTASIKVGDEPADEPEDAFLTTEPNEPD